MKQCPKSAAGTTLGYADDVVLLAESKEDMNRFLHIVEEYGKVWEMKFSNKKCKVIEFNTPDIGQ